MEIIIAGTKSSNARIVITVLLNVEYREARSYLGRIVGFISISSKDIPFDKSVSNQKERNTLYDSIYRLV